MAIRRLPTWPERLALLEAGAALLCDEEKAMLTRFWGMDTGSPRQRQWVNDRGRRLYGVHWDRFMMGVEV